MGVVDKSNQQPGRSTLTHTIRGEKEGLASRKENKPGVGNLKQKHSGREVIIEAIKLDNHQKEIWKNIFLETERKKQRQV